MLSRDHVPSPFDLFAYLENRERWYEMSSLCRCKFDSLADRCKRCCKVALEDIACSCYAWFHGPLCSARAAKKIIRLFPAAVCTRRTTSQVEPFLRTIWRRRSITAGQRWIRSRISPSIPGIRLRFRLVPRETTRNSMAKICRITVRHVIYWECSNAVEMNLGTRDDVVKISKTYACLKKKVTC